MKKEINVIGHLGSSSGLGNTARLIIAVLHKAGYKIAGLNVDYHASKEHPQYPDIEFFDDPAALPYDTNLIIVAIQLLPSIWLRRLPGLLATRFTNIGYVFWELPVIPPAWRASLALFDSILVSSQYVRSAIESSLPDMKTVFVEHPLSADADGPDTGPMSPMRSADAPFTVMSSFDLRSEYSRKNPFAVLKAFQGAFPDNPDVRLLIKANGQPAGSSSAIANQLLGLISGDTRIELITQTLPYAEVMHLYSRCDAYLSMHRSEGLGLGPMEAMLFGKLTIATGYSGNMTYMNHQNSIPLPYQLVRPEQASWQFLPRFAGKMARWAEPDLSRAIASLRYAHAHPEARERIAAEGQRQILLRQQSAWSADFMEEAIDYTTARGTSRERPLQRRRVLLNEFLDPTLLKLNVHASLSKLLSR